MSIRIERRLIVILTMFAVAACSTNSEPPLDDAGILRVRQALGVATEEELRSLVEADSRAVQEAIATCMNRAGFEYVADVTEESYAIDPQYTMAPAEFAGRFGFGISTRSEIIASMTFASNPNEDIFAKLSSAQQLAYERSLYGADPSAGPGGCQLEANESLEAQRASTLRQVGFDGDLTRAVESVDLSAAELAWTECASARGFSVSSRSMLLDQFLQRTEAASATSLESVRKDEIRAAVELLPCDEAYRDDTLAAIDNLMSTT